MDACPIRTKTWLRKIMIPNYYHPLPSSTNVFNVTVPMVDLYDFGSRTWSNQNLPPLPTPRGGTASAVLGSEVLVIGGESGTSTDAHNETEAFDVNSQTWRSLAPLLPEGSFKGRHATQAIVNNGSVYIAAGSGKQGGSPSTELNTQQVFSLGGEITPTGTPLTKSQLTVAPSSVNFGPIASDQTGNKTLAFTNTNGNQAINLLDVSISGNAAFSLVALPPSKLLLPGETMNIGVAVKPSVTDQGTLTGSLSVKHTANTAPLSIALTAEVTDDGGDTAPQVQNPIANITVAKGASAQTIDLSSVFADDGGTKQPYLFRQQCQPGSRYYLGERQHPDPYLRKRRHGPGHRHRYRCGRTGDRPGIHRHHHRR